ncbi:MAG: RsiV family protein [Treponema sp.]|jgi:hypothetical protein|nr:RsiV family protein [Treponema sp.]
MKISYILFFIVIFVGACSNKLEVTGKDYVYEKMLFDTHRFTFEIHLENIGNSQKFSKLIEKLIYQDKNFDEYAAYTENEFIGNINKDFYPQMIDDDGTEYFYHSDLIKKFNIISYNNSFVIVKYSDYLYYAGAAHGIFQYIYYIIDIAEEKILKIDDLITPFPDDVLKEMIEEKYEIGYYFDEPIWSPDTINFNKDNIELLWNVYRIAPYVYGAITIEIPDAINKSYLTEKGKQLKRLIK